jgi:hypothetical protein
VGQLFPGLIPINAAVAGRSTDGHNIRLTVTIQVPNRQILDGDTTVFQDHPLPGAAGCVAAVNSDATAFLMGVAEFGVRIIPNPDDQFVRLIAIQIRETDRMSPTKLFVNDLPG